MKEKTIIIPLMEDLLNEDYSVEVYDGVLTDEQVEKIAQRWAKDAYPTYKVEKGGPGGWFVRFSNQEADEIEDDEYDGHLSLDIQIVTEQQFE